MIKIVGAGISGLVLARRLAEKGKEVIVYDKSKYIGGLLYDYKKNGFYISDSGVHIFHTNDKKIMKYMLQFGEFIAYNHLVSADVYNTDFSINFPPSKNNRLDKNQFNNLYSFYSLKQWGEMPSQDVLDRCKARDNNSLYFFKDKYVGLPLYGWYDFCKRLVDHPNIKIILKHEFTLKDINEGDKIYYTGRLDRLFNFEFGEMEYRTIKVKLSKNGDDFANVMNKSIPDCKYTRVINWRRCSPLISLDKDLYGYEYPFSSKSKEIAPHYIVGGQDDIYNKYKELAKSYNIIPFGRIGGNKYINIDEAVKCALTLHL